jgi:tRNA nucleotidyltransferase (CCA-adding enzyme)
MPSAEKPIEDPGALLRSAYPELDVVAVAADDPVYVVGGAVRDLLLGRGRADLDLVVVGDAFALATRLGAEPVEHERFGTAKVGLDGHELDLATARTETYAHPGALPDVAPASGIEEDLGRRDFTINAMAIPLGAESGLIDPHRGQRDLEDGALRVLHAGSFVDDPTRAIRAARYAARLGFGPEPETAALLRATDLGTVSTDRRRAELLRLAGEDSGPRGLALLADWGLIEPREGGPELAVRVAQLLAPGGADGSTTQAWSETAPRAESVLRAALGPAGDEAALAAERAPRPSRGYALARGRDPVELVLARALGAEWLDAFVAKWSAVELEIDGSDLIAAGVPEGPAVGRGLLAAREAKLDGEIAGRAQELAAAVRAAQAEG